jgi:cell division protein FtsB
MSIETDLAATKRYVEKLKEVQENILTSNRTLREMVHRREQEARDLRAENERLRREIDALLSTQSNEVE